MLNRFAVVVVAVACVDGALARPDSLSPAEKAAGWAVLFDGSSTDAWRGYKQPGFPAQGWAIEDGCLKTTSGGGDIITRDQYANFELDLEWKAAPKANSGIMYRVTEANDATWQSGPEFQVLDDVGYGAANTDMHSAGALYDLQAPAPEKVLKPAGEWNHARIRVDGSRIRHFVNGVKVVDVRMDDDSWKARIAGSKFKDYAGFGMAPKGHIAIQDHGDTLWYRNIKVRDLGAAMPKEEVLFDATHEGRWIGFVPELAGKPHVSPLAAFCSFDSGIMTIKGQPIGYAYTEKPYTNYVLRLDWRFDPAKGPGNSGVLLRRVGEQKVWPKSVEAQLHSENAGDFWNIDNVTMTTDPARTNGRNTKKLAFNENPLGEWNSYEIVVDHGTISLWVNGQLLNQATGVEEIAGNIALQSEGAFIQFRDIRLAPIP